MTDKELSGTINDFADGVGHQITALTIAMDYLRHRKALRKIRNMLLAIHGNPDDPIRKKGLRIVNEVLRKGAYARTNV